MRQESSEKEIEQVYRLYAGLVRDLEPEFGLGGKLLFAGELDAPGRWLIRAANVAGAASLSATADAAAGREAMRDGVIDFLVNSLDEALRILKNEIRKRQTVAVGVTGEPVAISAEMLERGVRPDLLAPSGMAQSPWIAAFIAQGATRVEPARMTTGTRILILDVTRWANRMTAFDSLLRESLKTEDVAGRRWLRLSPRYLDKRLRNWRLLECDSETATRIEAAVAHGKLDSAKR